MLLEYLVVCIIQTLHIVCMMVATVMGEWTGTIKTIWNRVKWKELWFNWLSKEYNDILC